MKRYFKHFLAVFISIFVLALIYVIMLFASGSLNDKAVIDSIAPGKSSNTERTTDERVFDYADVLTDAEEDALRDLIAKTEPEIQCDIVLVTMSDARYASDNAMMNFADDFYDQNNYGYDKVHGDGALYLDNWKNPEFPVDSSFCWFSTCGRVESRFSTGMINSLIDNVNKDINRSPYQGYCNYVNSLASYMSGGAIGNGATAMHIPLKTMLIVAVVVTLLYLLIFVSRNVGKKTTTATTYMISGHPDFLEHYDNFINRNITKHYSPQSSSSGGGGHHISSGGVSHGGGGGRH